MDKHLSLDTVDAVVTDTASKATSSGAVGALIGWATSTQTIAVMSFVLAICGFAVNWIFQLRRDRREEALYNLKLTQLTAKTEADEKE